ncbi:hypothetical protein ACFFGR_05490 [Arthrobacter liuii]|uniref:Short chain dehydrogenase n=1 Tax=Arthrobacter liuii TaxID=1476996 RepID=A0ABQ2AL16_9MICC|nr:hypothetical protein [Arthrobacter liuii]GGH91629.1 hypothetical protein GCM10007170_08230 [Arthrobacter liuii]
METARRVVVVTGANGWTDRASAIAFWRRGYAGALLAGHSAGIAVVAAKVEPAGGRALPSPVDVVDPHEFDATTGRVEQEPGLKLIVSPHHRFTTARLGVALPGIVGAMAPLSRKDAR